MPQSLSRILVHLIFSTKDRERFLAPDIQQELHAYLATTLNNFDCPSIQVGGTDDHVHLLFGLSRTHSIANVVEHVKTGSSKWIKGKGPNLGAFHWQKGYGAFSIGESNLDTVVAYIQNQEQHHKRMSFQDEFRKFLQRYSVPYDERYVWD